MLAGQPFSLSSNTLRGIRMVSSHTGAEKARSGLLFVKTLQLCICLTESFMQMSESPVGSLTPAPPHPQSHAPLPFSFPFFLRCYLKFVEILVGPTVLAHPLACCLPQSPRERKVVVVVVVAGANYGPQTSLQAPGWGLPLWSPFDLPVWNCVTPQECASPTAHLQIPECFC